MLSGVELRTFVAVVDEGSFGAAARLLSYSQPAVSAHVAHLEREIGGRLLERSRSQTELTPLGRNVLPRARQALEALEKVARAAEQEPERPTGSGAPPGQRRRSTTAPARAG